MDTKIGKAYFHNSVETLKQVIYSKIELNELSFNSPMLAEMFSIEASDVRGIILLINEDVDNFEYGIISIGNRYKLAKDMDDINKKYITYKKQYKTIKKKLAMWETRHSQLMKEGKQNGK